MDSIIQFLQNCGVFGLFLVSFLEAFISPILPDFVLIPMSLAHPEKAIFYACVVIVASMIGGIIGYGIGAKYGMKILNKTASAKHVDKIHGWFDKYGVWAIFIASMAPIPFKLMTISAGVFKVNFTMFCLASTLGRIKRFLIIGVLIDLYGAKAINLINAYSDDVIIGIIASCVVIFGVYKAYHCLIRKKLRSF